MKLFDVQKKVVLILVNEHRIKVDYAWMSVHDYEDREIFYDVIASDALIPVMVKWCLHWLSDVKEAK